MTNKEQINELQIEQRKRKKYSKKKLMWTLGTWYIKSLQCGEKYLGMEFEETDLDILAIKDTKNTQGMTKT